MNYFQWIITILLLLCFSPAHSAHSRESRWHQEPSLKELLLAFKAEQDLDHQHFHQWERQIRKSAFLPVLSLGYDHQLKSTESTSISDNVSISSGVITVGPEEQDYDWDGVRGQVLRVRALWRLDEAVFSSKLLSLAREKRLHHVATQSATDKFIKIYESRRLSYMQYQSAKTRGQASLLRAKFNILTDEIDALTGERFKERLVWEK